MSAMTNNSASSYKGRPRTLPELSTLVHEIVTGARPPFDWTGSTLPYVKCSACDRLRLDDGTPCDTCGKYHDPWNNPGAQQVTLRHPWSGA